MQSDDPGTTAAPTGRFASLDALRGIAAMVVVIHHALLTVPSIANLQVSGPAAAVGWQRLIGTPPLHLIWAGSEAVTVFFVLSGVVLTLAMQRDRHGWRAYYVRRLTRLYLPVWAAVGVAVVLSTLFVWHQDDSFGWWLSSHAHPVTWHALRWDTTLLQGTDWLDAPLWSLRWEVLFSLLLPVYLLAVRRARWWLPVAALLVLIELLGDRAGHDSLRYLPIFGFGVLLGVHLDSARRFTASWPRHYWWLALSVSLLLLDARWISSVSASHWSRVASMIGATGVVAVVALAPGSRVLGASPALRWLGRVSFSLYLVHEPILVSVAQFPLPRPWSVLALGIPLALLVTVGFHRWAEVPAQRLAARLGRLASSHLSGASRTPLTITRSG